MIELVPKAQGGGGGIWGWGGVAYSAQRDSLFAVTANAFEGGSNAGAHFDEAAGYGEHLVELTRDLRVRAANHPATIQSPGDFDFSGSPVIFTASGCDETVAATNKNGRLFLWHSAAIEQGPYVDVAVQPTTQEQPLLTQTAYDAKTRSLFVAHRLCARAGRRRRLQDGARVVEGAHAGRDAARLADRRRLDRLDRPAGGSPSSLRGYDTKTGRLRFKRPPAVLAFVPPAIVGGRVFEGARHAFAVAKPRRLESAGRRRAPAAYTSWSDTKHGWQSRENGVFATDDGGKTWRRIYGSPAQRVLALTATRGVISVGTPGRLQLRAGAVLDRRRRTRAGTRRTCWRRTSRAAGSRIFTWSGHRRPHGGLAAARLRPGASRSAAPSPVSPCRRRLRRAAHLGREGLGQRAAPGLRPARSRLVDRAAGEQRPGARALADGAVAAALRAQVRLHGRRAADRPLAVQRRW